MAIHTFRFVGGVNTGVRIALDLMPDRRRQQQRSLSERISLGGWDVVIPELYADRPTDNRPVDFDHVTLRRWTEESIGITRLPVGLVRFVESDPVVGTAFGELPVGWNLSSRCVTIWPNGMAVSNMEFCKTFHEAVDVAELRRDWDDCYSRLRREAIAVTTETTRALALAMVSTSDQMPQCVIADPAISAHRIWNIDAEPTDELIHAVRDNLVLIGRDTEFVDVQADENVFCFPGNGFSVEIGLRERNNDSMLVPVTQYYQYWIGTTMMMDDQLHEEFARISNIGAQDQLVDEFALVRHSNSSLETRGESMKDSVREHFFAHRDVLNAMSPRHLAIWRGYVRSWRLPELEADLQQKITAIEDIGSRLRDDVSNNIARKTTAVVTLLTALTLVSITIGIAAFVWTEDRLSGAARTWLVAVSMLAAILLFALSIRPTLIDSQQRKRLERIDSEW